MVSGFKKGMLVQEGKAGGQGIKGHHDGWKCADQNVLYVKCIKVNVLL